MEVLCEACLSAEEKSCSDCVKPSFVSLLLCVDLCIFGWKLGVLRPMAAAEVWFLSCLQKAYVNQAPFHALFTAVKLGYPPDACTAKNTVLHSCSRLQGLSMGRTHTHTHRETNTQTHTAEGFSFAFYRQVTVSLENVLFAIQFLNKELIQGFLSSLWGIWKLTNMS